MADSEQTTAPAQASDTGEASYVLDAQVGFLLRQAQQRHTSIFARRMLEDITPTQWAALAKLAELGPCSQNLLGRHVAMDAATIKGVVDRLVARKLIATSTDPEDNRRLLATLTDEGHAFVRRAAPLARKITEETLAPLSQPERRSLLKLIAKLR
jgi:DNA-binding MarR family transcriptional regulator